MSRYFALGQIKDIILDIKLLDDLAKREESGSHIVDFFKDAKGLADYTGCYAWALNVGFSYTLPKEDGRDKEAHNPHPVKTRDMFADAFKKYIEIHSAEVVRYIADYMAIHASEWAADCGGEIDETIAELQKEKEELKKLKERIINSKQ